MLLFVPGIYIDHDIYGGSREHLFSSTAVLALQILNAVYNIVQYSSQQCIRLFVDEEPDWISIECCTKQGVKLYMRVRLRWLVDILRIILPFLYYAALETAVSNLPETAA